MTVSSSSLNSAILAMHAYNVGLQVHTKLTSSSIGNFAFNSLLDASDGFSAATFISAGKGYLSIRGTNTDSADFSSFYSDLFGGYILGAGKGLGLWNPWASQIGAAVSYYQAFASSLGADDFYAADITLVGHSLGGGLGGYVASIYGKQAYLFDNMPFTQGALSDYQIALAESAQSSGVNSLRDFLYPGIPIEAPNTSQIHRFATQNEFLAFFRLDQGENSEVQYLASHYENQSLSALFFQYHSIALQVDLQWAELYAVRQSWTNGAQDVFKAYFDPNISDKVQLSRIRAGSGADPIATLEEAIAYSAVSEGVQPFGNTAIRSMFDDMADIGEADVGFSNLFTSPGLYASTDLIARITVEFAAEQAFAEVVTLASETAVGVLSLGTGGTLSVDLSPEKWDFADKPEHTSGYKTELIQGAIDATIGIEAFDEGLNTYIVKTGSSVQDNLDLVSSVSFALQGAAALDIPTTSKMNLIFLQAGTGADASGSGADRIIVGSSSADHVIGGSEGDIIFGGHGNDFIEGGQGTNFLYGGEGSDWIVAKGVADTIVGGHGNDIIELDTNSATIEFSVDDGSDVVQFDLSAGDYTLYLKDLNPNDIEVIGGGFDAYFVMNGDGDHYPDGMWYQFLTVRSTATGDQITFLENGLGGVFNIGPSSGSVPTGYNKGRFVPGHPELDSRTSTSEGQLDRIVFANGSQWDQATIWDMISSHDKWAYAQGDNIHGFGYGPHNETNFLSYVENTYLHAYADYLM